MKEQLITFETANLAKKKRFDWECRDFINETQDGNLVEDSLLENYNNMPHLISFPTQSLLQKWLREVHHIVIDNTCYFSLTKFTLKLHTFENGEFIGTVIDSVRDVKNRVTYKSYEEALEEGLQEALKLIK